MKPGNRYLFEATHEDLLERMEGSRAFKKSGLDKPAVRAKIEARLKAAGEPVNDATVAEYYRHALARGAL
jgi:hypothetical protein